ncbi:MAG: hypothetical protein PVF05_10145 [Gemmatimonadales bacterium]|jgi:hypothetical protein
MTTSTIRRGFLPVYAGVLTTLFALSVITGFTRPRTASFDEIDVGRINVREPDGTLRLVLSSKARFPGLYFEGKEYEHPNRSTAGILFFNDEGTEQGGLIYGGETDADGVVNAYNHLSFDQYEQDQVLTLSTADSDSLHKAGFSVWDRPDWSMQELMQVLERTKAEPDSVRQAAIGEFFRGRESAHPRMYIGKSQSGAVSVRLNDPEGRERLILEVAPDGTPALRMLDAAGNEVARFPDQR